MLDLIVAASLIISVIHMRRTIKSTNFVLPNETLVNVHLFNFIGWFILYFVDNFFLVYHDSLSEQLANMSSKDDSYDEIVVKVDKLCFCQLIGNMPIYVASDFVLK